jgi:hypothetical protein
MGKRYSILREVMKVTIAAPSNYVGGGLILNPIAFSYHK